MFTPFVYMLVLASYWQPRIVNLAMPCLDNRHRFLRACLPGMTRGMRWTIGITTEIWSWRPSSESSRCEERERESCEVLSQLISDFERNMWILQIMIHDSDCWIKILITHAALRSSAQSQGSYYLSNLNYLLIEQLSDSLVRANPSSSSLSHPSTSRTRQAIISSCSESFHPLCGRFQKMQIPERYGLCMNCLHDVRGSWPASEIYHRIASC